MHSVVETPTYLADAKQAGLDADERQAIVTYVAGNPPSGRPNGGHRWAEEVSFKRPGTGKGGGDRVVFYYGGDDVPLFLLNVFTKGDRANFSKAECNELRTVLGKMAQVYREGVKT